MAYPIGVRTTTIAVGGKSITGLGTEVSVKVYVRPTHFLVWAADGSPVIPAQESTPKAETTLLELPQVDQAGFIDQAGNPFTFWAYTITVYYRPKGSSTDYVVTKNVQPLAGQDFIDFELIPDGDAVTAVVGDAAVVTSVNGMTGAVTVEGGGGVTSYTDLTDKPFIPTAAADVGAQPAGSYVESSDTRLTDARTPLAHEHTIADVPGLGAALDGKQPAGSYVSGTDPRLTDQRAPLAHNHPASDVTGLAAVATTGSYDQLTDKPTIPTTPGDIGAQPAGSYVQGTDPRLTDARTPLAHTHTVANVTGLQASLDGKAAAAHAHAIADVSGLQTELSKIVAPRIDYARKSGSTWPARPTASATTVVIWIGADPSPTIVSSGTSGMRDNVDIRWVTP